MTGWQSRTSKIKVGDTVAISARCHATCFQTFRFTIR